MKTDEEIHKEMIELRELQERSEVAARKESEAADEAKTKALAAAKTEADKVRGEQQAKFEAAALKIREAAKAAIELRVRSAIKHRELNLIGIAPDYVNYECITSALTRIIQNDISRNTETISCLHFNFCSQTETFKNLIEALATSKIKKISAKYYSHSNEKIDINIDFQFFIKNIFKMIKITEL
jgi:hypothetical protein